MRLLLFTFSVSLFYNIFCKDGIFVAGQSVAHSFAYAALFRFLREVWIQTQRAAVASRRTTNLLRHPRPSPLKHNCTILWQDYPVEGLYCKRPIQCLASSKVMTPYPLTARRVCTPPPMVRGEDTLAGWRGGWGVNSSEDARHYSVLYYM